MVKNRSDVNELLPSVREKVYPVVLSTGQSGEDVILDDGQGPSTDDKIKTKLYTTTIGDIAKMNYAIVNKALAKNPVYKFNTLKKQIPEFKIHKGVYYK